MTANSEMEKELILYLVRGLVDIEEMVAVSATQHDNITTYLICVDKTDIGKVIGKEGRIANALRTVVKAAAMKYKRKVYIEIHEEGR